MKPGTRTLVTIGYTADVIHIARNVSCILEPVSRGELPRKIRDVLAG